MRPAVWFAVRLALPLRPSASESVMRPTFARSVWSAHGAAHVPTPSAPHEAGHSARNESKVTNQQSAKAQHIALPVASEKDAIGATSVV